MNIILGSRKKIETPYQSIYSEHVHLLSLLTYNPINIFVKMNNLYFRKLSNGLDFYSTPTWRNGEIATLVVKLWRIDKQI